jgi:hypothetical protein
MKRLFHLQGKRFTAALTVLLLSASQLAVAMHACSPMKMPSSDTVSTSHHAVNSGRDCDCPADVSDGPNAGSALCKQHCESGHQNLAKPFVADHISFVAVISIPSITRVETDRAVTPRLADRVATSPPFLRNTILRI